MDNVEYGHHEGEANNLNEYDPAWRSATVIGSGALEDKNMTGQELLEQLTALRYRRVCNKARVHQCQAQLDKCTLYKQMSAKCGDHDDVNFVIRECKQRMQTLVTSIDEDENTINLYVHMLQAHRDKYRLFTSTEKEIKEHEVNNAHYAHNMTDINGHYKDFDKSSKANAEMYSKADRDNKRDRSDVNADHNSNNNINYESESSKNVVKSKMSELLSSPYLYSSGASNEVQNASVNKKGWRYVPINSPEAVHSVKMNNGCSAGVVIFHDNVIPLSHFFTNIDNSEVGANSMMPPYARQFSETRSAYHAVMDYCTGVQKGNPLSTETAAHSTSASTFTGPLYLMQDKETRNFYVANAKGENLLARLEERNESDKEVLNASQSENIEYNATNNNHNTNNDKSIIPMTQIIYPIPASLISQEGKLIGSVNNHLPDSPSTLVDQYPYEGMVKVDVDARLLWHEKPCQPSLSNVVVGSHTEHATLIPAYLVPMVEPSSSGTTEDTLHRLPTSALYNTSHEVTLYNRNDNYNDDDDNNDDTINRDSNTSARRSNYADACKYEQASTYNHRLLPSLALPANQHVRAFRQSYETDITINDINRNNDINKDNSINDNNTASHNQLGMYECRNIISSIEQEPRIMRPPTEENMSLLQIKSFSAPKEAILPISSNTLENNLKSKTSSYNNSSNNDDSYCKKKDLQLCCQQGHVEVAAEGINNDKDVKQTKECATNTSEKQATQVCTQGSTCNMKSANKILTNKLHFQCKAQGDDKNIPMLRNSSQSCRLPNRIPRLQSKLPSPYETVKMQRRLQPFASAEKLSSTVQPQKSNRHV